MAKTKVISNDLTAIDEVYSQGVSRGQSMLSAATNTTLTNADTYYKISGTYANGGGKDFTVAATNKATYTGVKTKEFLLNGVSEIEVDTTCKLTYGLYINGTLVPGAETPHDFTAPAKTETISITAIIELNENDYLEVWAKSDQAGTVLTTNTLNTTYWGSY